MRSAKLTYGFRVAGIMLGFFLAVTSSYWVAIRQSQRNPVTRPKTYDLSLGVFRWRANLHLTVGMLGITVILALLFLLSVAIVLAVFAQHRRQQAELANYDLTNEIAKRKRIQEEINQLNAHLEQRVAARTLELENANLAKDRFLASMSHELRTPLNAILGFTGTLLMKLPGPLTNEQSRQLQVVQKSAKHLLSLINDLLDLAKIGSGKLTFTIEPVELRSVVDEVCGALRPLAQNKGLELQITAPQRSVVVNTDRRAFGQILLNLTNNAIKFTDRGGVYIVVGSETHDGKAWIQLSVNDTGTGIGPEDQHKIFQPFSQVEGNVRRHEGTGLGLHLSKTLAESLGGQINLKSEVGRGSTFTLSLPDNSEG